MTTSSFFTPFWDAIQRHACTKSVRELYQIGKGTAIKKNDTCQHFREQAKLFHSSSTVDEVVTAEENALVSLYNGKAGD